MRRRYMLLNEKILFGIKGIEGTICAVIWSLLSLVFGIRFFIEWRSVGLSNPSNHQSLRKRDQHIQIFLAHTGNRLLQQMTE